MHGTMNIKLTVGVFLQLSHSSLYLRVWFFKPVGEDL